MSYHNSSPDDDSSYESDQPDFSVPWWFRNPLRGGQQNPQPVVQNPLPGGQKKSPQPEEPVKKSPQPEEPVKKSPQPEEPVKKSPQPVVQKSPQPEEPVKKSPQPEEPVKKEKKEDEKEPLLGGQLASLRAEAKSLGLRGYTRWKKQQLIDEIALHKGLTEIKTLANPNVDKPVDMQIESLKLSDVKRAALNAGIKLSKYSKEIGRSSPKKLSELKEELKQYVDSHKKE